MRDVDRKGGGSHIDCRPGSIAVAYTGYPV